MHSPLVKVVHPSLFGALCASKNRTHKLWGLMYSHSLLWPSWCVWKYKNVPRSQKIDCAHMSYFVRRHCPYFVHFVRLKIKRTNLWGLPFTQLQDMALKKSHQGYNFLVWNFLIKMHMKKVWTCEMVGLIS